MNSIKLKMAEKILAAYGRKPGEEWTNTAMGIAEVITDCHQIHTPQGDRCAVRAGTEWFLIENEENHDG